MIPMISTAELTRSSKLSPASLPSGAGSHPEGTEQPDSVPPQAGELVAPLVPEPGRQPQRGEPLSCAAEALGGHLQRALRVASGRVHAQRDDKGLRTERAEAGQQLV